MNELDKATLVAIEEEKKYISENCEYFIDEYGWYQDRDKGGEGRFKLWPGQKRALKEMQENRLNIILKARQLGLTWLVLWYALWNMIRTPGYGVSALSKRDSDAKELIERMEFMLRKLPSWLIVKKTKGTKDYPLTWYATATRIEIYHRGKEKSRMKSETAGRDSGRSFTESLVIQDEWAFQQWAEEIWTAAFPTVNRPTGGKFIGLSTNKRGTLFEQKAKEAMNGENNFHFIFLPWHVDPRRDQKWYEAAKKELPNSYLQEYPATPTEAFSAGEDTSFPEFDRRIHVCDPFPIPEHWRRWRSVDNGYSDPFAWYWFAVSEDGIVYVYREYTRDHDAPKVTYSDQAREVKKRSKYEGTDEDGNPAILDEPIDFTVAGHDAWNTHHRDQNNKTIIDYYMDGGLGGFIEGVRDRAHRKATMHEYLKPFEDENTGETKAKLQIFSTCKKLIETLPELVNDEHDPEKVADMDIDHWYESCSLGLTAYHTRKSEKPKEEKPPIRRHKEKLAKRTTKYRKRLM